MRHGSLQARWRLGPYATDKATGLLTAVEAAVETGEGAFEAYLAEPHRGAWWGRLVTAEDDVFVKARRLRHPRQRWASLMLPRGLITEWRQSLWFLNLGLPCAEPVAFGEYRTLGMLDLSLLVIRWVPGSRSLREAARDAEPAERSRWIRAAGTLVGRLFRHGVIHRQPHPGNFLVAPDPATGDEVLMPIDLQHLWISPRLTDDDFLWALDQVSFWLHDPVIDWADHAAARSFFDSAVGEAEARLADAGRIRDRARALIDRGGRSVKRHRHQWSP